MREHPIIFSGPMVRAILEGRKTQTRRLVKDLRIRPRHEVRADFAELLGDARAVAAGVTYPATMNAHGAVSAEGLGLKPQEFDFVCPYADGHTYLRKYPDGRMQWHIQTAPSRLWVRETFKAVPIEVLYRADFPSLETTLSGWRPSIHMPRWASRITLEVTGIRVERLQDISEEDAKAEGCSGFDPSPEAEGGTAFVWKGRSSKPDPRAHFVWLWESINGPGSWAANPWVWVVEFRRIQKCACGADCTETTEGTPQCGACFGRELVAWRGTVGGAR